MRLPAGSNVLVCSDLHLSSSVTEASRLITRELCDRLGALTGPGAVVLNGDCFELLAAPQPSVAAVLDAHHELAAALALFGAGVDRRIIVTVGNHDARLAWDGEASAELVRRLGASVAIRADLLLETNAGVQVVRIEHGHQFDPANAMRDARDPYDTPLGHHVVQEVLPQLAARPFLADVPWLSDPEQLPRFLGSRVVYRELLGRVVWLAVPLLLLLLLVRTPLLVAAMSSSARAQEISRWAIVALAGLVADVLIIGALTVAIARRCFARSRRMALGRDEHI